jgi:hypothetical protein
MIKEYITIQAIFLVPNIFIYLPTIKSFFFIDAIEYAENTITVMSFCQKIVKKNSNPTKVSFNELDEVIVVAEYKLEIKQLFKKIEEEHSVRIINFPDGSYSITNKKKFKDIKYEDKESYLKENSPFAEKSKLKLTDKKHCSCCEKTIVVGDYKIEIEDDREYIVCPNAPNCDGSIIGWFDIPDEKPIKKPAKKSKKK